MGWASGAEYESMYEEHNRVVFLAAYRLLRDRSDAQDVVQHVFLKAWSGQDLFDGGNAGAWLTTLAKNRAIDVLRRRKRDDRLLEHARETLRALECDVAGERLHLQDTLSALTPDQRLAVVACIVRALPHAQAADLLGWPLGTLKSRVRAALRRMRHDSVAVNE